MTKLVDLKDVIQELDSHAAWCRRDWRGTMTEYQTAANILETSKRNIEFFESVSISEHMRFKPLQWENLNKTVMRAEGVSTTYTVVATENKIMWQSGYMKTWHEVDSVENAKAQAQTHHEGVLSGFFLEVPEDHLSVLKEAELALRQICPYREGTMAESDWHYARHLIAEKLSKIIRKEGTE